MPFTIQPVDTVPDFGPQGATGAPKFSVVPVDTAPDFGDAPTASGGPGAFSRGLVHSLLQDNPGALADALEGASYLLGDQEWAGGLRDTAGRIRAAAQAPAQYAPQSGGLGDLWDNPSIGRALTYLGESAGSAIGSTLPSMAGGTAGAIVGGRIAGKPGAAVGAFGGAALPAGGINYGGMYRALLDEGVKPEAAAKWAKYAALPITALDVAPVAGWAERFAGQGAKQEMQRAFAKRILQEALKGGLAEGLTEGAQQVIQERVAADVTGTDFWTPERMRNILDNAIGGALAGGAFGGASGIRRDQVAPPPQPEPEPVKVEPLPLPAPQQSRALPSPERTYGEGFTMREGRPGEGYEPPPTGLPAPPELLRLENGGTPLLPPPERTYGSGFSVVPVDTAPDFGEPRKRFRPPEPELIEDQRTPAQRFSIEPVDVAPNFGEAPARGRASFDDVVASIHKQESGGRDTAKTSVTGARGGMQIQPATFAQYARPGESIDRPADNIAVGRRIIADLWDKSGGDPARVAVGYFSGPGNIAPAGAATPWKRDAADPTGKTTSSYVEDVLKRLGRGGLPWIGQDEPKRKDVEFEKLPDQTPAPDLAQIEAALLGSEPGQPEDVAAPLREAISPSQEESAARMPPVSEPILAAPQTPEIAPSADASTIAPGAQQQSSKLPAGTRVRVKLQDGTYAGKGAIGTVTGYVEGKRPRVKLGGFDSIKAPFVDLVTLEPADQTAPAIRTSVDQEIDDIKAKNPYLAVTEDEFVEQTRKEMRAAKNPRSDAPEMEAVDRATYRDERKFIDEGLRRLKAASEEAKRLYPDSEERREAFLDGALKRPNPWSQRGKIAKHHVAGAKFMREYEFEAKFSGAEQPAAQPSAPSAEQPAPITTTSPETAPVVRTEPPAGNGKTDGGGAADFPVQGESAPYTLDEHAKVAKRILSGDITADELKATYARFAASKESLAAELNKRTLKQLAPNGTGGRTKKDIVSSIVDRLASRFIVADGFSWSPFSETQDAAYKRHVDATTDEQIKAAAAKRTAAIEGRKKALTNPETLSEFQDFVDEKGEDALSKEQRAKYDELRAVQARDTREREKERAAVVKTADIGDTEMEIVETKHTKKGTDLFVVKLSQRVDGDVYKDLLAKAKRLGGYYSAFRGNGAVPGFQFPTRVAAEKFTALKEGAVSVLDSVKAREEQSQEGAVSRMRDMADRMEAAADESLSQDRKANTDRRARMAASAEEQARAQKAMAQTMRNLADAIESGEATHLSGIRHAVDIETIDSILRQAHYEWARSQDKAGKGKFQNLKDAPVTDDAVELASYPYPRTHVDNMRGLVAAGGKLPGVKRAAARLAKLTADAEKRGGHLVELKTASAIDDGRVLAVEGKAADSFAATSLHDDIKKYDRMQRMGLTDLPTLRAALREYLKYRGVKSKTDPIVQRERALLLRQKDNWYATPESLARRMVDAADLKSGARVLEPSAGTGRIADAAAGVVGKDKVEAVETSREAAQLLTDKGYAVIEGDFLKQEPTADYDAVLMNPPFKEGTDIDHVRHAWGFVKPGGKLVAIMSEGPFFRQDKKATEFRAWLESVGGESEKLPDGTFKESGTGVATRLVTIKKESPNVEETPRVQSRSEQDRQAAGDIGGPSGSDTGVVQPQRVGEGQAQEPSAGKGEVAAPRTRKGQQAKFVGDLAEAETWAREYLDSEGFTQKQEAAREAAVASSKSSGHGEYDRPYQEAFVAGWRGDVAPSAAKVHGRLESIEKAKRSIERGYKAGQKYADENPLPTRRVVLETVGGQKTTYNVPPNLRSIDVLRKNLAPQRLFASIFGARSGAGSALRAPWSDKFPSVITHTTVSARDGHPDYVAAKSGDPRAAIRLAADLVSPQAIERIRNTITGDKSPLVVPARAVEASGVNEIPDAVAGVIASRLGLPVAEGIVQTNVVGHTRASAAVRFAKQPEFTGPVQSGATYLIVDDHVGMGGTIANLRGYIESNGGIVIGATTLTASRNSETIALHPETLAALRSKHGELEDWWRGRFGHGYDALTEPEAQHLNRIPGSDAVRDRIIAAVPEDDASPHSGAPGEVASSRFSSTWKSPRDRERIAMRVGEIVRQIAPQTGVETVDDLKVRVGGRDLPGGGQFDPVRNLVTVALNFGDPEVTAGHEAVHALRNAGLFTPQEWATLEKAARDRWIEELGVRDIYRGVSDDVVTEEAIAQRFAEWRKQPSKELPAVRRAFTKIRDFFRRLANALRGMGFRTPEDVFEAAERGDVGRRVGNISSKSRIESDYPTSSRSEPRASASAAKKLYMPQPGEIEVSRIQTLDDVGMDSDVARAFVDSGERVSAKEIIESADQGAAWIQQDGSITRGNKNPETQTTEVHDLRYALDQPMNDPTPAHEAGAVELTHAPGAQIGVRYIDGVTERQLATIRALDAQARRAGGVLVAEHFESPGARRARIEAEADVREFGGEVFPVDEADTARASLFNTLKRQAAPVLKQPAQKPGTSLQQSAVERIFGTGHTPFRERVRAAIHDYSDRQFLKVKQAILDQFASVKALERETRGDTAAGSRSPYKAIRLTRNLHSVMAYALRHGPIAVGKQKDGGVWFGRLKGWDKGGFEDIFKPIAEKGLLDLWKGWAVAVRADRLLREGRENLMTRAEINALLPLGRQYPEFVAAHKKWQAFNNAMLDMAEASGLVNAEQRALWENADYIPFFRVMEDEVFGPGRGKSGVANQRSGIRKLKGGTAQLNDPIENMVMNMTSLVDRSFKNLAARKVVALALEAGVMERERYDWRKDQVTPEDAARELERIGVQVTGMTPQQHAQMLNFWRMQAPTDPNVISVMVGGKPQFFRVHDPMLLQSLTSMTPQQLTGVLGIFRAAKRLLTEAITIDPAFMAANGIRDTLAAYVTTGQKGFKPFVDSMRGFAKALKEDDPTKLAIMANGGGLAGFYGTAPEDARKYIERHVGKIGVESIMDTPRKLWEGWHKIGQASESANRIAIADAVKKNGGSEAEQAYQAMDLLDFGMRGASATMRVLIETIPFLNARVQGLYRLGRGAKENPKAFLLRGSIIAAASLALLAENWDNDEYERLEDWDKDTYWHLWVDGVHLRLPKPFEVGAMFGTIPERMARAYFGKDDMRAAWKATKFMLQSTFSIDMPQLFGPLVEEYANKDTFTGRPIVGADLEKLPAWMQYRPDTSETAREAGATLSMVLPKELESLSSPERIEHMVGGYFGTLGTYLLSLSDQAVRLAGDYPSDPTLRIDDIPVVKRFVRADPQRNTRFLTEFYDLKNEVDKTAAAVRELGKRGETDDAEKYVEERAGDLAAAKVLDKAAKAMTKLRLAEQSIMRDRQMTPAQKRRAIDEITTDRNAMAEEFVGYAKTVRVMNGIAASQ